MLSCRRGTQGDIVADGDGVGEGVPLELPEALVEADVDRVPVPEGDGEVGSQGDGDAEEVSDEDEELVEKCIEVMRQEKKASTSLFQRRLRLGYTRAARILDILEARGYVAAGEGAKPREILRDLDAE